MRFDRETIRRALFAAFDVDKSKTLMGTPSDEAKEIVQTALDAEQDLRGVSISNGQSSNGLAVWATPALLSRAHYGGGIDNALEWLDRVLQIRQCDAHIVMPLWGINVQQSLDLADRVRLVPATEFSQSGHFHNYFRARQELPIYRWQPPSAVLLRRLTFSSIFVNVGELTELDWQVLDLLHDIRNCLALSGPVAIAGDTQWIEFVDPDLNDYNSGIWSRAQEIQPHNLDFGSFDPDLATVLVPKFLTLAGEQRNKIYLATDRFVRALWRHNASEAALELGITLDSLVGDGAGELVFKVGLRAALLLGGNLSDRRRRREIVKSVYDLRSKVVHTGASDKTWKFKGQQMPTKNFVELAIGVTAEVIREIIILGEIPNWNDVEVQPPLSDHSSVRLTSSTPLRRKPAIPGARSVAGGGVPQS
jgi:Apea-like HEPN